MLRFGSPLPVYSVVIVLPCDSVRRTVSSSNYSVQCTELEGVEMAFAIVTDDLRKRYGEKKALTGVDLRVPEGAVCGLLGPNGAGKTTMVRILATLLRFDGGRAEVAGLDVARHAAL